MRFSTPKTTNEDVIVEMTCQFYGEVWIGDPCYVVPDKDWSAFCDFIFAEGGDEWIVETSKGTLFVWGTKHGDGSYPVLRDGKIIGSCGVDAGLLSVMYYATAQSMLNNEKELKGLGTITNVHGVCEVSDHDLTIGDVEVTTSY